MLDFLYLYGCTCGAGVIWADPCISWITLYWMAANYNLHKMSYFLPSASALYSVIHKGIHNVALQYKQIRMTDMPQHLILLPLNMKCLLQHYGSYDLLPLRISGKFLQLETVTQTEAMWRRYRFLSHFSLTTTFQICEIEMSEILPPEALLPFMEEIKKRENQRKQLKQKEHQEKIKAEAALVHTMPIPLSFGSSIEKSFSMDDFEALGSAPSSLTPPLTGERKRFSDVTRLGFAAAHDSPSLKIKENTFVSSHGEERGESSNLAGPGNAVTPSFANIISTAKSPENSGPSKDVIVVKKGKKPSRALLSTVGGRRY